MKVKRLPKDPGPAAWNEILPPAAPYPALEEATTADWLIIGAGFTGLAAARRLSQLRPEDRIVVLEASRVAHGPAGRNSGVMVDLPHDLASDDYGGSTDGDLLQIRMNRTAIDFAADAARDYEMPEEALRRIGKINAATTEAGVQHNKDYAAHIATMGEDSDILDARQMLEITGSSFYMGGLFTPGAVILQPALYIRGLAAGIVSNRVQLFEKSPVTELTNTSGSWLAKTPSGSVSAPKVILAVNGHVESFGFYKRRLMHIFTYASMTRKLTSDEIKRLGGRPDWSCTPSDPMGTTVRRISGIGGDRLVVRNRFTYDPSMEVDDNRIKRVALDHDRSFENRFPMLKGVDMEYRWGGRLCISRNSVPAFGEVDSNLYSACCQNGLGTAKGTMAGILAAEKAVGQSSDLLDAIEQEPLPSRLPPEPFAWLGANAVIRWKEHRAGNEV